MSTNVLEEKPMVKPPQKRKSLRSVIFFAASFVVGTITGVGLAAIYLQPTPPAPTNHSPAPSRGFSEGFVSHMRDEYGLSDEQTETLKVIVKENNERVDLINKEFRPKFTKSIESMNAAISAMMNAEQQAKFKKKLEEFRARWANRKSDYKRDGSWSSHSHSFGGGRPGSKSSGSSKASSESKPMENESPTATPMPEKAAETSEKSES